MGDKKFKGIKERYPKIPTNSKIRGFIQMIRPFTAFAAFIAGFFLTYTFSMLTDTPFPLGTAALIGFILAIMQGAGQALNQSTKEEVEIDKINGKTYRPTVSGLISLKEGQIFAVILMTVATIISFYLDWKFGVMAIVINIFAATYTLPPIRSKKRFFINNLHQAISRGLLPPIFVSMLFGDIYFAIGIGIAMTMWVIGFQTTKDFDDVEGDRKFNIRTLPVVLGKESTVGFILLFNIISGISLAGAFYYGAIPLQPLWTLLLIPIGLGFYVVHVLKHDVKMNRLENSYSWILFYITLMLWYAIPTMILFAQSLIN